MFSLHISAQKFSSIYPKIDSVMHQESPIKFNGNVLITKEKQKLYQSSFGVQNFTTKIKLKDTDRFEVMSISKQLTAVMMLKAVEAGAQNIVFGALTPGNEIDTDALETVSIAAQGLPITFHMAFDEVTDQEKAIDQLVEFGVDKILTHGGPLDQPLNTDKLKSIIDYAKGKINIIIGGGVNAENFENLAQLTGTNYVHGTKIIKL